MAKSLAGGWRGGPAKIAVIASSVFGTISGSAAANVMTTGSFTIPMMKKLGYKAVFAGAVEAVASTGGQIMPPVMGASAFIMAEILGITYFDVAARAAVPALLYYATLLAAVHMEAIAENLPPVPAVEINPARFVFSRGWTFLIPLVGLVALLAVGFTPEVAGFYAVLMTAVVPALRRITRLPWLEYISAMAEGSKSSIPVVTACAAAGIIIGVVNITGLGFRFSSIIINLSGGSLLVALVLTMFTSIILGMGLPTTPAYIVMATLIAPALVQMGVKPIAAHMFCFYYAILAAITPPVAIACFAAAPLAKVSASQIGWRAFRLALPVYFVPYLFVYDPALLILQGWSSFLYVFIKAVVACAGIAVVSVGSLFGRNLSWVERLLFMAAAFVVIYPSRLTDFIGTAATLGLSFLVYRLAHKKKV
jgi:TRAP transporter 4TM/12TM fusion protein